MGILFYGKRGSASQGAHMAGTQGPALQALALLARAVSHAASCATPCRSASLPAFAAVAIADTFLFVRALPLHTFIPAKKTPFPTLSTAEQTKICLHAQTEGPPCCQ